MRNKPRCGLFTCALTILGATVITTTLLLHNYVEKQYHVQRGPASRQAALRDARDAAATRRVAGRSSCETPFPSPRAPLCSLCCT